MDPRERPEFARGGIVPAEAVATGDRPPPYLTGCYYALIKVPREKVDSHMTLSQFAYRHIRSFRREEGGLYAVYTAVYSRAYRAVMIRRHRRGGHGRLTGLNGRCTWCGEKP